MQSFLLAELNTIRYDFETNKATMYENWNNGTSTNLSLGDNLQGVDENGMQVPYPGTLVYAEVKFYINGDLKNTVTLGTYMEPDEIFEME